MLGVLCLLAPSIGADASLLSGAAQDAHFDMGAFVEGQLRGILSQASDCGALRITGNGATMHAEFDEVTSSVVVAGASPTPTNQTTRQDEYATVDVAIVGTRDCRIVALPIEAQASARFETKSLALAQSGQLEIIARANSQRAASVLQETASMMAESSQPVKVTGHVRLIVYGANITIVSPSGTQHFETGSFQTPVVAGVGNVYSTTQREAYLDFEGAILVLADLASPAVNLDDGVITMDEGYGELREVRLDDARIAGTAIVNAPFTIGLTGTSSGMSFQVLDAKGASLDGQAFQLDRPAAWPAVSPTGLIVVAAVIFVVVAFVIRQRRRIRGFLDRQAYAAAASAARPIAWIPIVGRAARVALATSLVRLGRLQEAEQALRSREAWRSMEPTRSYLMAHIRAIQGDSRAATNHLIDCLSLNPGFVPEARADPALREIIDDALRGAKARRVQILEGYT